MPRSRPNHASSLLQEDCSHGAWPYLTIILMCWDLQAVRAQGGGHVHAQVHGGLPAALPHGRQQHCRGKATRQSCSTRARGCIPHCPHLACYPQHSCHWPATPGGAPPPLGPNHPPHTHNLWLSLPVVLKHMHVLQEVDLASSNQPVHVGKTFTNKRRLHLE